MKKPNGVDYETVYCEFLGEQFKSDPRFRLLTRGQIVTLRGTPVGVLGMLEQSRLVKVGPSTAIPTTLREIEITLGKKDGTSHFAGKDVLLRVRLNEPKPKDVFDPKWRVAPPTGSTKKVSLELQIGGNPHRSRFLEPNPGDTVLILATVDEIDTAWIVFRDVRMIDSPPPGLTLPEEK